MIGERAMQEVERLARDATRIRDHNEQVRRVNGELCEENRRLREDRDRWKTIAGLRLDALLRQERNRP